MVEILLETNKPPCFSGEVDLRQVFYTGFQDFPAEIPSLVHSGDWLANKPFINSPPFLESRSHFPTKFPEVVSVPASEETRGRQPWYVNF